MGGDEGIGPSEVYAGSLVRLSKVRCAPLLIGCLLFVALLVGCAFDQSGLDPREEARTNIVTMAKLRAVAARLGANPELAAAIEHQNAALSQRIINSELYK